MTKYITSAFYKNNGRAIIFEQQFSIITNSNHVFNVFIQIQFVKLSIKLKSNHLVWNKLQNYYFGSTHVNSHTHTHTLTHTHTHTHLHSQIHTHTHTHIQADIHTHTPTHTHTHAQT